MQQKHSYEKYNQKAGDIFGRLTLTGRTSFQEINGRKRRLVEARCICGDVRDYVFYRLKNGETLSCGCLRKDVVSKRMTKHHKSQHPLHDIRQQMIQRCYNPNNKAFKNYGGRGIGVCDEWRESFQPFFDWCIKNGWEQGLQLDREDNDGWYTPSNCRLVSRPVNNRNTRRNRKFTAFGETKCLFDWGKDERCKISVWGLRSRIDKGWDGTFEEALTTPVIDKSVTARKSKVAVNITAFGETKCMAAWLEDKRCVVKMDSLRERYRKGWDGEKILTTPPHSSGKKGILNSK